MRKLPVLLAASILCLSAAPMFAADQPATAAPPAAAPSPLSPAIQSAINDFSSDDFKTRQAATAKLQIALSDQLRALATSNDPEVLTRIADLLQFNAGLSHWIVDTLKLPPDQRKAQLDFGLQPENLPTLALTFSFDPEKRIQGIKTLAKIDNPLATDLIAPFLNDTDRAVYLAAMEAVWDRKPTDVVVNSLWERAVGDGILTNKKPANPEPLKFRDQPLAGVPLPGGFFANRKQDTGIAVDVLINLKAPQVPAKIVTFLETMQKEIDPSNPDHTPEKGQMAGAISNGGMMIMKGTNGVISIPIMYNPMGEPVRNVFKLAENYQARETFPILYKLATEKVNRVVTQSLGPKDAHFASNRTAAVAALIVASGQKPEDYNLKRFNFMNGIWAFPAQSDETDAIKKLHDWYVANVDKNVPDITDDGPAPAPKNAPAPGNMQ